MERRALAPTLLDGMAADLGSARTQAFFDRANVTIPWDKLAEDLKDLFDDTPAAGRPHWPVLQLLKILLLQKWFNLSDPLAEEMLKDRLSFRRFVGLSLADATPDETTLVVFRRRLQERELLARLFETIAEHLESQGLVLKTGTLVDATIVEAPLGHKKKDGSMTTDACASKTFKHKRTYNGYKAHIATDTRGIITDYAFDTASVHDSQYADQLMAKEPQAVYADSAYMDKTRKAKMKDKGVFYGVIERRVRGQKELSAQQKQHNRFVAGIRAMVEHPFAWMARMGYGRTRYRGMRKNAWDFGLTAIAYNLKRAMSLACVLI